LPNKNPADPKKGGVGGSSPLAVIGVPACTAQSFYPVLDGVQGAVSIQTLITLLFFVAQPALFRYGNAEHLMKRRMDAAKGISFPLPDGQG